MTESFVAVVFDMYDLDDPVRVPVKYRGTFHFENHIHYALELEDGTIIGLRQFATCRYASAYGEHVCAIFSRKCLQEINPDIEVFRPGKSKYDNDICYYISRNYDRLVHI